MEGEYVFLSGGADDNQDGFVNDAGLRWRSDRDGDLGSGFELNIFLTVGTHVLTLEAENSVGLTATITTTVTVEGDYDYDGILDGEELAEGLNPLTAKDAYSDEDRDGLPLIVERKRGLDPNNRTRTEMAAATPRKSPPALIQRRLTSRHRPTSWKRIPTA